MRSRDGGIIGEATIDFINQFKVDYGGLFDVISGIDEDGSLLEFDYQEVRAKHQAIIANSRRVYISCGLLQVPSQPCGTPRESFPSWMRFH